MVSAKLDLRLRRARDAAFPHEVVKPTKNTDRELRSIVSGLCSINPVQYTSCLGDIALEGASGECAESNDIANAMMESAGLN